MTDCLIIGFNDSDFTSFVEMVKSMGVDSGAYRDLNLAFIEYNGKPQRSMDMLSRFYFEGKGEPENRFHNADFLWPVVTYLGSYLTQRGYTFDYVNLPHIEKGRLVEKLRRNDILTIAITTTLYVSVHPILELIKIIRENNTTAKIVVGGPYISNMPKTTDSLSLQRSLRYIDADFYVISSEGETALVNIIEALKNGGSFDKIDNLAYKNNGKYVMTGVSIESNAIEDNMVNYRLFPAEEVGEFVTLRTAKSCPFSCSFCGFPQRAGKYKYLSVELVEQELKAIRDIGAVTTLTFIDDTFNVPKERFREILRMMIKNNYGFKWNSFYRCDHGDDRTIELMGKAGCEGVFLGIESGSDQMLERMNKTARRKDYLRAIPLLRDAGIRSHANVIVGFPGETYDAYRETIDLIEISRPDTYRAQLWYADPVTPIWEKRDQYGVKGSAFTWSHNTMDSKMACDWVDRMFLDIQGSVWLPQNGFEQWSTFYLQRKGMSFDQIIDFLKAFNAIVKEKLRDPSKTEASYELIEALRTTCQFDETAEVPRKRTDLEASIATDASEAFNF
jgi:anaerobic magnesium-protoporphyrin IX monomethyl ester cyclase